MVLKEVIQVLEDIAPQRYAMDWDNVGLLAGDSMMDIDRIYLALDADEAAISEAKEVGAQLLITHHPLIFSSIKKVNTEHFISARVVDLLWSHMNYYAMHTNFDIAQMADLAAERIGIMNGVPLEYAFTEQDVDYGIGKVGQLPQTMTMQEISGLVKSAFELDNVRVFGDLDKKIECAAVSPGSGKSMIKEALAAGADVLITGDIDHHSGIDAVAQGLSIIDAGHYGLEHIFIAYMKKTLGERLTDIEIFAQGRRDPFVVI